VIKVQAKVKNFLKNFTKTKIAAPPHLMMRVYHTSAKSASESAKNIKKS